MKQGGQTVWKMLRLAHFAEMQNGCRCASHSPQTIECYCTGTSFLKVDLIILLF